MQVYLEKNINELPPKFENKINPILRKEKQTQDNAFQQEHSQPIQPLQPI